jgi:putative hydrolase of the HAD superfamily
MVDIKHYSFDLWLTLIRSNPAFKETRAKFFYDNLNFKNKPLDEVVRVFRQVDLMCNHINEKTGKNIDADEMYLMVISMLNDSADVVFSIDTEKLYTEMEHLMFKYMPVIYCEQTVEVLMHLKQNTGCTTNILSNTGFIKGTTLRKALAQIGLAEYFDFQLYSDETGMSKPNPAFFGLMLAGVQSCTRNPLHLKILCISAITPVADIAGAGAVGMQSLLN